MRHRRTIIAALFALVSAAASGAALAASAEIYLSGKDDKAVGENLAAGGYDVVAYFTEKKPVLGKKEFETIWKDAKWRFSSQENLEKFQKTPEAFAPQFGGYCALALAYNSLAPGDPKAWSVVNGKLYLNLSPDIRTQWEKQKQSLVPRAEKNWPKVLK